MTTRKPVFVNAQQNFTGNIEVTYNSVPFSCDEFGMTVFTCKKIRTGQYAVSNSSFLGHETDDVKKLFNQYFYGTSDIETLKKKIQMFVDKISEKHPYCDMQDISHFNSTAPVKLFIIMKFRNRNIRTSVQTTTVSNIENVKMRMLSEYNLAYGENLGINDVKFLYRIFE